MTEDVKEADFEVEEETEVPAQPTQGAMKLFTADNPAEIVTQAKEYATALNDVLEERNLIANIQGSDHVEIEGWTLLGSMLGVFPVTEWTKKVEDGSDEGWEARVVAKRSDGSVVGAAEASCMRSEGNWSDRDEYALRSMAQTRASSKALRMPLGFIVTLAGYNPTPAEEMDGVKSAKSSSGSDNSDGTRLPNFGKAEGQLVSETKTDYLKWYKKTLDPDHDDFGDQNRQIIDAIEEELESRSESKEEPADHQGKAKVDTARLKTKEMLQKAPNMSTDDMMELCEDTVEYLVEEFDDEPITAWREVYKTIREVVEDGKELKMNDDGYIQTIPF